MFSSLSNKLSGIFSKLRGKGVLSEADIDAVMREVRIALLEADVALPVVKDFIASLKVKAVGVEVIQNVNPAQMVIKLVNDHLTELLGSENQPLNLATTPPAIIMMVGLQGSGKTTSTGKLALRLKTKQNKKVLVASLDIYRPAAQEQLAQVAKQAGIDALPIIPGQKPQEITERAIKEARLGGYDVLLLDTAGRLHIDGELMDELKQVKQLAQPIETLLVADSLTGQDAVNIAKTFHEQIGVSGLILTRVDGDGRGGAALSMRAVTGQPIKFIGVGEKLSEFEEFHPARIAGRILDMGDIVALVEKAAEAVDQKEAEQMAERMMQGQFDFNDLLDQMRKMKKMGGFGSMLNLLPGMGKLKEEIEGKIDDNMIARQEAIILSMTKKERQFPKLINASRRQRIAKGAGVQVQDVNKILKQQMQMADMMKKMKKMGQKGLMRGGLGQLFGGLR
ncbi:MAG: signal recognition particle protein [Rickettsiales bacterium]|jgi:signal recognition particle subunit SRP54|nr:signal recognition particle protein [Rickettsiales bacterium]